ncbi:MAG: hypothetical protein HRU20_20515 [Pseudomonadales bacterium]|nr:hypothetical protein [Pseudomonadales bacterium]
MHTDIKKIQNTSESSIDVIVEPWGLDLEIPSGETGVFIGSSEQAGNIEVVDCGDYIEVYGWHGSGIIAEVNGREIWDTHDNIVPGLPEGMSTRDFITMVFKSPK